MSVNVSEYVCMCVCVFVCCPYDWLVDRLLARVFGCLRVGWLVWCVCVGWLVGPVVLLCGWLGVLFVCVCLFV